MTNDYSLIIVLVILIFAYSLLTRRLEGSRITAPLLFVLVGLLVGPIGLGLLDFEGQASFVLPFVEIALVVTLTSDAAAVDFRVLRQNRLPLRLLSMGLPLTIFLGSLIAALIFKDITLAEAGLIGSVLAPTDASLGQSIVKNPKIPIRIRQALDVESGLNDGGSVPFFALFFIIAQAEVENIPINTWLTFAAEQIISGIIVGVVAGIVGNWLMQRATSKGWMETEFQSIALVALALLTYLVATSVGGSGFIAAYTAGLMMAAARQRLPEAPVKYASIEAEVLGLGVFFLLGLAIASSIITINLMVILYTILSLTIIRMVPVAISLIGSHLDSRSVLFIGWFGPRGLASIVLILITLESTTQIQNIDMITSIVLLTVLISVFAHGLTAIPAINRIYGSP